MNRVSMMGELAASLAHEISQPIAGAAFSAKACLQWLQHEPPDFEGARKSVSRFASDVKRAADIVDRNRSLYSRASTERAPVNVNEIIQQIVALLQDAANRNSIWIRTELDPELPLTTADRVQIQQVLMNLMLNGIEAMKGEKGELNVRSKKTEDGQLLVSVSDAGVGLPVEEPERIFEAFFTTKPQGTGMGLAISRRIIEAHGGRLCASANTGQGTIFQFELPTATTAVSPSSRVTRCID
jgi:signal transduction histidine kinase